MKHNHWGRECTIWIRPTRGSSEPSGSCCCHWIKWHIHWLNSRRFRNGLGRRYATLKIFNSSLFWQNIWYTSNLINCWAATWDRLRAVRSSIPVFLTSSTRILFCWIKSAMHRQESDVDSIVWLFPKNRSVMYVLSFKACAIIRVAYGLPKNHLVCNRFSQVQAHLRSQPSALIAYMTCPLGAISLNALIAANTFLILLKRRLASLTRRVSDRWFIEESSRSSLSGTTDRPIRNSVWLWWEHNLVHWSDKLTTSSPSLPSPYGASISTMRSLLSCLASPTPSS